MNPIETLTDEALLLKLSGTEHDFVERKPRGQKGEWLQVAVAFANSAPIGWPAVLFVGVDDVGTPQQGPEKLEDLSKSVAAVIEQAYPPIYFDIRPLHIGDRACLMWAVSEDALRHTVQQVASPARASYPLRRVDLSFDGAQKMLLLEVRDEIFR